MLCYICDDSKSDLMRISHYLNTYSKTSLCDFEIKCFTSGEQMLNSYKRDTQKPEIIFLDIYMTGENGISVAKELIKMGCENGIVFTTSSQEHALEAFKLNADGYLHKPYTQEDFANCMKRFANLFTNSQKFITLNFNRNEIKLNLNNLLYVETKGHCTYFHTNNGEIKTTKPIKEYAEYFDTVDNFILCGKSFILNALYISQYSTDEIVMDDGISIPIPVRSRHMVGEQIKAYKNQTQAEFASGQGE